MLGDQEWVPVWACLVALYSTPFLLVFIFNRRWTVLVSLLAYLLTTGLWQLTYARSSPWYDIGSLVWVIYTMLFVLIPMLISGGIGLLIRRLIRRYARKA